MLDLGSGAAPRKDGWWWLIWVVDLRPSCKRWLQTSAGHPQGTDAADNPAQPHQIKMCDEGWRRRGWRGKKSLVTIPLLLSPLAVPTILILLASGFSLMVSDIY